MAIEGRHPIQDSINYRRHRNACPYYREDWGAANALYRSICLLDYPPETAEEQELCLKSRKGCWRLAKGFPFPKSEEDNANCAAPTDEEGHATPVGPSGKSLSDDDD